MQLNRIQKLITKFLFVLTALPWLLQTTYLRAAEPSMLCIPKSGYVFMYINGVWNGPEDAVVSMNALVRSVVGVGLRNGSPVEFVLAYNPTSGKIADVKEALAAKAIELSLDAVKATAWLIAGKGVPMFAMTDAQRVELFKKAAELEAQYVADAVDNASVGMPDLAQVIQQARNIDVNKSLIIVGHSEGTIFANLVYNALLGGDTPRDPNSMRVMGIAAAANQIPGLLNSEVPGGEAWVTNQSDVVINLLRADHPTTLRGNVFAPPDHPDDFSGHMIVEIYLNPALPLRAEIKSRIDIAFNNVKAPVDISACKLVLNVSGTQDGWIVYPEITLDGLTPMSRLSFNLLGTPGNTCGGERGFPPYSQDASIPVSAKFFGAPLVSGAPHPIGRDPNRRPCSSFVAFDFVPDPAGIQLPKYRVWASATARAQSFSGSGTFDTEAQLRYDSGDPWTGTGARCAAGSVAGANVFGLEWNLTSCIAKMIPS